MSTRTGYGAKAPVEDLRGQVAIISGGASGIGRAVAVALARAGAHLVVNDRREEPLELLCGELTSEGVGVRAVAGDVSDYATSRAMVDMATKEFGGIDLAFNNAGVTGPRGRLADVDPADFRRTIDVNLCGVFYAMHCQIPAMIEHGGGSIVNMSSALGLVGREDAAPYSASKHGVTGLTKSAALAYAPDGVRVNSVHPGYIETPMVARATGQADDFGSLHPIGRLGTASEVAQLVVFLLSPRAAFITGSQMVIDGGYTAA